MDGREAVFTPDGNNAVSTTNCLVAVIIPDNGEIAVKSREATIGVGVALEASPDSELALADGSNRKLQQATTVAADVGVFKVAVRDTVFD